MKFFEAIKKAVGKIDIVAEDLVRLPLYRLLLCRPYFADTADCCSKDC
jgi:hypothetical protein